MNSKVVIFGAKGTLGQELVREFFENNYELISYDKDELDLTNFETIKEKIIILKPNIIINASGYNAVDLAETDENEKNLAYLINAEVPKILAEVAGQLEAIFVNYSTDFVFDGEKGSAYVEDDAPRPMSEYAKSKYLGEQNVAKNGKMNYIIRPSRIFGRLGQSGGKKSFVEIMLAKKDLPEIKVVNDERGSPTFAPDLAKFTRSLIENKLPFGIYHGVNQGDCSWYEWAEEIFKLIHAKPALVAISAKEYNNPARRPKNSSLISTKIKPLRHWKEALKDCLLNN
jgi:dTDP-4-dehydrorhamnose reductase